MKKILIFLFVISVGCKNKVDCNLDNQVLKSNDSILLKIKSDKLISKLLVKMEEPELRFSNNEIYRFMIIGAWENKQFYKVINNSDSVTISSKRYWKYYDGVEIDSLGKENTKKINATDWMELKNSLNELNFWSLPISIDDRRVLDGTAYVIEGYSIEENECTKRNYHITTRISPRDTTLYKSIFKKVIKFASE